MGRSQAALSLALLAAIACVLASIGLDLASHVQAGLSPRAQAWSATVAALLAWQGLHAVVLLLMGGYAIARSLAGKLLPRARATLDNTALQWHYVTAQGLAISALVQGLPRLLG
jgi:cytochrome c oxidase subunit I+III